MAEANGKTNEGSAPATVTAINGKSARKPRGPNKAKLLVLKRVSGGTNAWNTQEITPLGLKKVTPAAIRNALEKSKIPGEYKVVSQKGSGFVIAVEKLEVATARDVD